MLPSNSMTFSTWKPMNGFFQRYDTFQQYDVFDMKTDEWYHFYFVLFYCPERNRWFTPRPITLRYSPVESIGACMIIVSSEDCRSTSRSRVTDDSGTAELCYILCILCDVISLRYRKTFVRILKNFCTEKKYISF